MFSLFESLFAQAGKMFFSGRGGNKGYFRRKKDCNISVTFL